MALTATYDVVDASLVHVAIEARGEVLVDDAGVYRFVGIGTRVGLVVCDPILFNDFSSFIDCSLLDNAMRSYFGIG